MTTSQPAESMGRSDALSCLPSEVLMESLAYLDAKTLLEAAHVSSVFHRLTLDTSLWGPLVSRDFVMRSSSCERTPWGKDDYLHKVFDRLRRLESEKTGCYSESRRYKMTARREMITQAMDLFHVRLLMPCLNLLVLTELAFLGLHLDGLLHWSIAWVLAPIWLIFLIVLIGLATGMASEGTIEREGDLFFLCLLFPVKSTAGTSKLTAATSLFMFCTILLFIILVTAKASEQVSVTWPLVFAPLWWCMLGACLFPCIRERKMEISAAHASILLCLGLPTLCVAVLALLRLSSGLKISAPLILTPLFVLDALMILVPCVSFLVSLRRSRATGQRLHVDHSRDGGAILCCISCILVPWVVFEALLCVYIEGKNESSARGMLSPLVVWFSALSIFIFFYAFHRRSLRPRPF
mmetsp:Transcript_65516/g.147830  ORF Transcript_65516/g.147830 Transcript_65516/m.147830 type:complete len:409 (+) Transcript_65516:67-1293(+)